MSWQAEQKVGEEDYYFTVEDFAKTIQGLIKDYQLAFLLDTEVSITVLPEELVSKSRVGGFSMVLVDAYGERKERDLGQVRFRVGDKTFTQERGN